MKLDDLVRRDAAPDESERMRDLHDALAAFGYISVMMHTSAQNPLIAAYECLITSTRADGTFHRWHGFGSSAEAAEFDAIETVARWILQQPIP